MRIDNDKTQQEIADILSCNRQVYARYERGLREIPFSMVIQLAKYYNVSIDYIAELTDDTEMKLDEADRAATSSSVRFSHEDVFKRLKDGQ